MKNYIISALIALLMSTSVFYFAPEAVSESKPIEIEHIDVPGKNAVFTVNNKNEVVPLDFTSVASQVMPAVVHIRSIGVRSTVNQQQYPELPEAFRDFFKEDFYQGRPDQSRPQQQQPSPNTLGSGSGVIINKDGYIVTNNHVVANADEIEVTLYDNRTYKATVIGTDPSTDLALVQIKEKDLPTVSFANSGDVKVGEWVLAVGNPFNLNSTVTAGIVSAKSRSLNILQDKYPIESFIQTDAAINPGNSGGALVNLQGGLIGINTAIASPTGSYAGYGFAVPSNIVGKVVEDLIKFGVVQRGYLGVTIRSLDANLKKEKDLDISSGIYVDNVSDNSAAKEAGLQSGDVILKVEENQVNSIPELQSSIARFSPGDLVNVTVNRSGKEMTFKVKLRNIDGDTNPVAKNKKEVLNILGAELESIDKKTAQKLNIEGGVKVDKLFPGKLSRDTKMKNGFIITKVDGKTVENVEELAEMLENKKGGVLLEGIYEDVPGKHYYALGV